MAPASSPIWTDRGLVTVNIITTNIDPTVFPHQLLSSITSIQHHTFSNNYLSRITVFSITFIKTLRTHLSNTIDVPISRTLCTLLSSLWFVETWTWLTLAYDKDISNLQAPSYSASFKTEIAKKLLHIWDWDWDVGGSSASRPPGMWYQGRCRLVKIHGTLVAWRTGPGTSPGGWETAGHGSAKVKSSLSFWWWWTWQTGYQLGHRHRINMMQIWSESDC